MSTVTEVVVPDIGDFAEVDVIEVLVAPGDTVNAEDPLITLESDKATMDVPAPAAGTVKTLMVGVGDKVSEGSRILVLETGGAAEASTGAARSGAALEAPAAQAAQTPPPAPAHPAPSAAPPTAAPVAVSVPDIGDFADVDVIEVLVAPGDTVNAEDPLITLESDKATMDVPAPAAGVVSEVQVRVGDKVSKGSAVLTLVPGPAPTASSAPQPAAEAPPAAAPAEQPLPPPPEAPSPPSSLPPPVERAGVVPPHASPAVRRFARELGADLSQIRGSGAKGRILKEDVQAYVKSRLAAAAAPAAAAPVGIPTIPEVDFTKFGPVDIQPLPRIKRISGPHLQRAWLNVPHVTNHDEADVTDLEAFRQSIKDEAAKAEVRVTMLAFITKAVAGALARFPSFNSSLTSDGQSLVLKKYFHIGIAVDTPNGLMVPVLRDVDKKGIMVLAEEMGEISRRARDGKLKPEEMQGGCMSISSLGGIGGTSFTPIVNAPEVAILGVSRARMTPVWDGERFAPRLMLPLSLSYDHRVVDGAEAARFNAYLCATLEDARRLLL